MDVTDFMPLSSAQTNDFRKTFINSTPDEISNTKKRQPSQGSSQMYKEKTTEDVRVRNWSCSNEELNFLEPNIPVECEQFSSTSNDNIEGISPPSNQSISLKQTPNNKPYEIFFVVQEPKSFAYIRGRNPVVNSNVNCLSGKGTDRSLETGVNEKYLATEIQDQKRKCATDSKGKTSCKKEVGITDDKVDESFFESSRLELVDIYPCKSEEIDESNSKKKPCSNAVEVDQIPTGFSSSEINDASPAKVENLRNEVTNKSNASKEFEVSSVTRNEEKENIIKSSRKYKCTNPSKKSPNQRSKNTKFSLVKGDSYIDMQISADLSNFKKALSKHDACTKPKIPTLINREKVKILDTAQTNRHLDIGKSSKKSTNVRASSNQSRPLTSRQKHTVCNPAVQPVWRPGGTFKSRPYSSASTTSLAQKSGQLSCGREKVHLPMEHTNNEAKQRKTRGASNNHFFSDIRSMVRDVSSPEIDQLKKVLRKRSNASLNGELNSKQRPQDTSKASSKHYECCNVSLPLTTRNTNILSKKCKDTISWEKLFPRKTVLKEQFRKPKKTSYRKLVPDYEKTEPKKNEDINLTTVTQSSNATNMLSMKKASLLNNNKSKSNEDEPARDVNVNQVNEAILLKDSFFPKTKKKSSVSLVLRLGKSASTNVEQWDKEFNVDIDKNFQSSLGLNCVMMANASCSADLSSSSDCIIKITSSNCCQTSLTTLKNMSDQNICIRGVDELTVDKFVNNSRISKYEKPKDLPVDNKKKKIRDSNTPSLNTLKSFLIDQGVNADLIRRAEKHFKEKQKTDQRTYSKRKSITFLEKPLDLLASAKVKEDKSDEEKKKDTPPTKRMDKGTHTERNTKDAFFQTTFQCESSKASQTEPEKIKLNSSLTQTGVTLIRHISIECCQEMSEKGTSVSPEKSGNISIMTQTIPKIVRHNSTETSTTGVSKSMNTENSCYEDQCFEEKPRTYWGNSFKRSVDELRIKSAFKEDSRKKLSVNYCKMSVQMRQDQSAITSAYSENLQVRQTRSENYSEKTLPKEIIMAHEIAAIRAYNIYQAIDIYKKNLKANVAEKGVEQYHEEIIEIKLENDKIKSNGIIDDSCADLNENNFREKLDCNEFSVEILSKKSEAWFSEKSSDSCIALAEVKSLMDSLLRKTDNQSSQDVCSLKKSGTVLNLYSPSLIFNDAKVLSMERVPKYSILSRENLFPLVYGVTCWLVIWCLEFSIKCDFGIL